MKFSPYKLDTFKTCVEQYKIQCGCFLSLDFPTRCNLTFIILEVAEKYQSAFELMLEDDGYLIFFLCKEGHGRNGLGPPIIDDCDHIYHFTKFLKFLENCHFSP